jgi:hypothetical protein
VNVRILNPVQYPDWDNLILSHPACSFFHSSVWTKVLSESYGYTPLYFAVFGHDGMEALIPVMEVTSFLTGKRGVSLPFTDYCDPLLDDGMKLQDLMNPITEYGKKAGWKYIEFRFGQNLIHDSLTHNSQLLSAEAPAQAGETRNIPFLTFIRHVLDLSRNEEELSSSLRDSTRRNIKKAVKEGVEVKIDHSLESVKEFCRLNDLTRKEHGLPPQPIRFFEKIHDHILSKGFGMVVLASLNQEIVAGAVYFHFGKKAVYKYGASNKKYQHLRANNLVMWEAIKWYSQNGYQSLCMGLTEPEHHGLLQFKAGWGAVEQPIRYYRYDFKKQAFISGHSKTMGIHNKLFRNMPIPILNKVGALLYRHFG